MAQPRRCQPTRWTLVLAAGGPTGPQSRCALEELCGLYWYPVYGFIRQTGKSPDDALDLTQGFFADVLERRDFASADPARGKFRSWLLGCAKHYLANQHDYDTAMRRGGGQLPVTIDATDAEARYRQEPVDGVTPEKLYLRRWVMSVLERSLRELRDEVPAANLTRFDLLRPYLIDEGEQSYAKVGAVLGINENAVKQAVHQLRERYRGHLRAQFADTLEFGDDVDAEIWQLLGALS